MVLRQPLAQRRRHQQQLLTITLDEVLSQAQKCLNDGGRSGVCATASQHCSPGTAMERWTTPHVCEFVDAAVSHARSERADCFLPAVELGLELRWARQGLQDC